MIAFQLYRMGALDFWSFHERMETPNVGAPPAIPLPPLTPPTPDVLSGLQAQALQAVAQAQLTGQPPAPPQFQSPDGRNFTLDPASGQIMEIRMPVTVVERLMAQAQLQIGLVSNSAGRKASGQAPPKMESKDGGTRQTISESSK